MTRTIPRIEETRKTIITKQDEYKARLAQAREDVGYVKTADDAEFYRRNVLGLAQEFRQDCGTNPEHLQMADSLDGEVKALITQVSDRFTTQPPQQPPRRAA